MADYFDTLAVRLTGGTEGLLLPNVPGRFAEGPELLTGGDDEPRDAAVPAPMPEPADR